MSQFYLSMLLGLLGLILLIAMAAVSYAAVGRLRAKRRESRMAEARRSFQLRREWLEADFLTLASSSGRPRGLGWANCDFSNEVCFARDRATGNLRALVGVTIQFEAIEGGGMEDVEAVVNLRAATAVFQFEGDHWETAGRAIFNLNPDETIRHFQHELEAVVD
jgi:hypothetical protein